MELGEPARGRLLGAAGNPHPPPPPPKVPFIADLKPSGKYVMEDVHKVGAFQMTACPTVFVFE
jgi:hypothetical protein